MSSTEEEVPVIVGGLTVTLLAERFYRSPTLKINERLHGIKKVGEHRFLVKGTRGWVRVSSAKGARELGSREIIGMLKFRVNFFPE